MKILIAPDKFKGSLTAEEVCNAIEKGIKRILPDSKVKKIPLADGGEGSLSILEQILNFKKIFITVNNPLFKPIKTYYGLLEKTAYIEMASASGLQLLRKKERTPMLTTTFGTGEMIVDSIKRGAKKIYLFIGGSATNDAGIGIASALGYKFKDEKNNTLMPVGKNLSKIKHIDVSKSIFPEDVEVNVLTDVNNPLTGKNGAAYVFAKQKGATEKEIEELDAGVRNFSEIVKNTFGKDVAKIAGSGAAGGVGGGAVVFCNGTIKSGINTILDLLKIDNYIEQSDLVITGEGLLDKQTLKGKVVKGVLDRCKKLNKPAAILCGDTTLTENEIKHLDTIIVKTIKTEDISKEESIKNAYSHLIKRAEELGKFITSYPS